MKQKCQGSNTEGLHGELYGKFDELKYQICLQIYIQVDMLMFLGLGLANDIQTECWTVYSQYSFCAIYIGSNTLSTRNTAKSEKQDILFIGTDSSKLGPRMEKGIQVE